MSRFFLDTNGGDLAGKNLDNQMALIKSLRESRIEQGITLEKAAETLGIAVSLLEAVEGFRVELSLSDLRQYAYACNAVIDYQILPFSS